MDLTTFFKAEFAEHSDIVRRTETALSDAFAKLVQACATSIRGGGKLMFFGNGGSAADAQHLATELTVRYKKDRAAIAAIALTTDSSALTAAGNDLPYQSENQYNISPYYEKGPLSARLTYGWRSEYLAGGFVAGAPPVSVDAYADLGLSVGWTFNDT